MQMHLSALQWRKDQVILRGSESIRCGMATMNNKVSGFVPVWPQAKWKLLVIINLTLGAFFWFLDSTDYSLAGTIPDLVFPLCIGFVALISWRKMKIAPTPTKRRLSRLACLPSLAGAGLYVLVGIVSVIPPFFLGTLFALSELGTETCIQQATSPDGTQTVEVYFRPVGAYSGGNGRIYIRVKDNRLPILERDIFYLRVSDATEETSDYLRWVRNDTLYISELNREVTIEPVKWEVPAVLAIPLNTLHALAALNEREQLDREHTQLVDSLPTYPQRVVNNQSHYQSAPATAFRSFNVSDEKPGTVADWYQQTLSRSPWSIIHVDRYIQSDRAEYCLQVQHADNANPIFLEILGNIEEKGSVHVNIGSPQPITDACKRYLK
jgi:hypothetical protein